MKRNLSILVGLLIAVFFIDSKFSHPKPEKTVKLQGFAISAPAGKKDMSKKALLKSVARRSLAATTMQKQTQKKATQQQLTPEQQEYVRQERIARARVQWERIRGEAIERLHLDDDTLSQYEALRDDYFNGLDQDAKRHYEENIEKLLGPERFHFLTDVREAFKQKVFERTQIEVGPLMGTL